VAIACGEFHSLALKANGTVVAWGSNTNGVSTVPPGLNNVTAIAAGGRHSAALKADGTVVAWGENWEGQTTIPAGLNNVVAIAAGYLHTLALQADGKVVAWGSAGYAATNVPPGLDRVVAIATGITFSMAIKDDGTLVVWGFGGLLPADPKQVIAVDGGINYIIALIPDVLNTEVSLRNLALGNNLISYWPTSAEGYSLESTTDLTNPGSWTTVGVSPMVISGQNVVTNPVVGTQQFFRLKR
jgi:hypothetical protein